MDWDARLTVATIIEEDGRFLLVEEYADGTELVYNQPAGHLDERDGCSDLQRHGCHGRTTLLVLGDGDERGGIEREEPRG